MQETNQVGNLFSGLATALCDHTERKKKQQSAKNDITLSKINLDKDMPEKISEELMTFIQDMVGLTHEAVER